MYYCYLFPYTKCSFISWDEKCDVACSRCRWGEGSCKAERKESNYKFLLCVACSGCCSVVAWARGTQSGLSSCTQCFIGAQPGIRVGAVKPHKEPNRWHLSSQHTELGMAHFCDILVTAQSHEDDRCHPNHYRAVFQWLQTQSKAIHTRFWVCKWSYSNQRHGDCTFQSAPLAALSRCAWLCIQAGRAGRTWWPRLVPEASPRGQRVLLLLCCTQHSSSLSGLHSAQRSVLEQGVILHKAFKSNSSLFRKACYSNGIPCQAWYSLNVPHWLQMWPSLTRLCARSSTGTAHCIFNLI